MFTSMFIIARQLNMILNLNDIYLTLKTSISMSAKGKITLGFA